MIMRVLSVIFFIISLVYVIIPVDYDVTMIGYIDDFMFFMSAFCLLYTQFLNKYNIKSLMILKMISLLFCFLGAVSLFVLSLFLK